MRDPRHGGASPRVTVDGDPSAELALAEHRESLRRLSLALHEELVRLELLCATIRRRLSEAGLGPVDGTPVPSAERFEAVLQRALRELDARGRHGGLVPLPELRRELAHLGLSRIQLDRELLSRQEERTLDLKVANDPRLVDEPDLGIPSPGRGLLYFVVVRP